MIRLRAPRSLRVRLGLTVLALLAAGLVGVPMAAWGVIRDTGSGRAHAQLDRFARDVTGLLPGGRTLALPEGDAARLLSIALRTGESPSFLQLRSADGQLIQTVAPTGAPAGAARARWPQARTTDVPDGAVFFRDDDAPDEVPDAGDDGSVRDGPFGRASDWWLRVSWLPDGRILTTGVRATEYDALIGRLAGVLGAITLLALIVLAVIAFRAIRRALRPLNEIAETAKAIGNGDLTRRVEPAEPRSEAGRLGLALNAMLGQIEVAFRERAASEERLRRFVADASHELRTPVATVRGYAELFRRGGSDSAEDLAKIMTRIESTASHMGVLVDELLLLADLDEGRLLESGPVDLTGLAAEALEAARAVEPTRPLRLMTGHGELLVRGDRTRLRQLLDNLLANVRTHTPAGTPATITVRTDGGADIREVVVEVRDEGPGLTAEQAAHVFERFYRAAPARTRGGAGLGLAIVAAVAEAHGGSARARPANPGAVFEIRLPLAAGPASVSFAVERDRPRPGLPGK
ncbi:ATP-binding protein [Nonomuraea sp. NPDC049269]|uniref:sensor histidine kinase n=1 Tax=Nonomuraea sp. NPDC049269 TaxID=3364349 RepID=UPI00371A2A33